MIINCPLCGPRDVREFTYKGHVSYMDRPNETSWSNAWDDYLHLRENPAGLTQELWYHGQGCGAWLVVTRNTITHEIKDVRLATEVAS